MDKEPIEFFKPWEEETLGAFLERRMREYELQKKKEKDEESKAEASQPGEKLGEYLERCMREYELQREKEKGKEKEAGAKLGKYLEQHMKERSQRQIEEVLKASINRLDDLGRGYEKYKEKMDAAERSFHEGRIREQQAEISKLENALKILKDAGPESHSQ